jgi:chemotaxis protein methyltransferase CheR
MAVHLGGVTPRTVLAAAHEPAAEVEVDLLLDALRRVHGYDLRSFTHASLRRRLLAFARVAGVSGLSGLQGLILRDRTAVPELLRRIAVPATGLFRDPSLFRSLRTDVAPLLRTSPSIRVWLAGCATGEEAYSMAILLDEVNLLGRTRIYATDLNADLLDVARRGAVPARRLAASATAYRQGGGTRDLEDHLSLAGAELRLRPELLGRITWAQHDLLNEACFNDFHLVVCANVLVYFTATGQDRVHRLLYESLLPFGFLALGDRELITLSPYAKRFVAVGGSNRVHKKVR